MAAAALIVALLAASAHITIPLGVVPVTLQVFVVVLATLLLVPEWAAAAVALYLAMGALGLPVFSAGQGGLGVIAGPTGGYLVGFLVGIPAGAYMRAVLEKSTHEGGTHEGDAHDENVHEQGAHGQIVLEELVAEERGAPSKKRGRVSQAVADCFAAAIVITFTYIFGTVWLAAVTGTGILGALVIGTLPFVLPDIAKAAAAVAIAAAVRRALGVTRRASAKGP
ncbi:MAG: biotin transporter BioY [Coriobacteriia bacterium]|nr:biotin transporter BioY [Coriobacteriia bacterium]